MTDQKLSLTPCESRDSFRFTGIRKRADSAVQVDYEEIL